MDSQTLVNKLTDHLLGKGWYIVDPVGGDQANDIIYEEIRSRYRAVDESPADRYRRRHPKCKWCSHCSVPCSTSVMGLCIPKDKRVYTNTSRILCSVFQLKKEN